MKIFIEYIDQRDLECHHSFLIMLLIIKKMISYKTYGQKMKKRKTQYNCTAKIILTFAINLDEFSEFFNVNVQRTYEINK